MNRQLLVILAAFVSASLAQVQVNTPSSVQSCLPVQLTWNGGKAPYFLGLIAGGQPSSPILKDFGQQTGNSYLHWWC
uniref:Secreted protein n=1 Tax=Phakopsora pachyrhizi TaxID=170000 RepID=A0A0S1MKM2_PHAPC